MRAPKVVRAARSRKEFVEGIIARLFGGIALTAEQTVAARTVVTSIVERQQQLDLHEPGGWSQLLRLNEERNAALAALLTSEADQARFETNAAEAQLGQAEIAWRAQTADYR